MTPQSAKAKGRKLQQFVRDMILEYFPKLAKEDVRSTGMGQQGADIQFSKFAQDALGIAVECKSYERIHVYQWYWQAMDHAKESDLMPVVVIKQNNALPLAVVDLEDFMALLRDSRKAAILKTENELLRGVIDE